METPPIEELRTTAKRIRDRQHWLISAFVLVAMVPCFAAVIFDVFPGVDPKYIFLAGALAAVIPAQVVHNWQLRKLAEPTPTSGSANRSSPIAVQFDDWGIYTTLHGAPQGKVAWSEITLVSIRIEDGFLPFPYWYVGSKENLLRIPNDAHGAKELFFDGLSQKLPGYKSDKTFRTIIEASGAMEGTFVLWKSNVAG